MKSRAPHINKRGFTRSRAFIGLAMTSAVLCIVLAHLLNVTNPIYPVLIVVTLVVTPVLLSSPTWKLWFYWPICYVLLPLFLIFGKIPWKVYGIRTFYVPFVLLSIVICFSFFWRRHVKTPMAEDNQQFILDKAALAFLIVLLVSLVVAGQDISTGLTYWVSWAVYILLIYHLLLNSFDNGDEIKSLITVYVISVAIVAIYGIINFVFLHHPATIVIGKSGGTDITLLNLNESSWIAMVTLPLSTCCALSRGFSPRVRVIFRIASLVILIQLLFSDARWAWASLFTGFIVVIIFPIRRQLTSKAKLLAFFVVFLLIGFLLYSSVPEVNRPVKSLFDTLGKVISGDSGKIAPGESDYPRMALLEGSREVIKGHWLFGTGVGNYWIYFPGYLVGEAKVAATPHNFYFRILAEAGIAGLLTFLLFLVIKGKNLFMTLRNEKDEDWLWILYGFAISFITLVIYELGLESAFSPFFWFFMGLLGATVRCRQQGMVS